MATEQDFLNEQSKFNNTYGINFSIKAYMQNHKTMSSLDFLSTDEERAREPITEYLDTLSEALKLYLENKTKMEKGKDYDMSDVSIGQFIEDFDNLMEIKHESELKPGKASTYKPLLGMDHERVFNLMWDEAGRFNRPLPQIWADNLVKNRYTMAQIKDITSDAIAKLDNTQPNELGENRKDLANLVMAKQAMENVRNSRGFWWKIWFRNWDRNSEEKAYLKELQDKITLYRTAGFPVADVEARASALSDVRDRLNDSIRTYKTRQFEKTKKKNLESPENMAKVFGIEAWKNINQSPEKSDALAKEIASKLPENGIDKTAFIADYLKGYSFTADIEFTNLKLKQAVDAGKNAEHQMKETLSLLYVNIAGITRNMGYSDMLENEVAAQIFMDVLMQQLPLVANNPEKYGKYANGYILNNAKSLLDSNIISRAQCNMFTTAKSIYDNHINKLENKPEQIIVDLNENNVNKDVSAPIIEEKEIKAPELKNSK
jgi:hypothetical protein